MTHPERQQDPFDAQEEAERSVDRLFARAEERNPSNPRSFKNLEALERRLGEIEGRLAVAECCIAVLTGQMTLEEANAELERLAAKRDQVPQEVE